MSSFTPASLATALAGGALIGAAVSLLLWGSGRRAGVSGIAAGLLAAPAGDALWRVLFLAGLLAGGVGFAWLRPGFLGAPVASWPVLAVAGVLVGFGTRLGGGCTSGHGICGLSRLSLRSLVAVAVFMGVALATVALLRVVR
jgi:uncharacterized membrane protein YedE/YeeE